MSSVICASARASSELYSMTRVHNDVYVHNNIRMQFFIDLHKSSEICASMHASSQQYLVICIWGWLWLVGSIKLQVPFAKEPYQRGDILQKKPVI